MANNISVSFTTPSSVCGICEQPGATATWFNHLSHSAHPECIKKIREIEGILLRRINHYFPENNVYRSMAHGAAIKTIKKEIGNVSILTFLETEGLEKLEKLCRSQLIRDTLKMEYDFTHAGPMTGRFLPNLDQFQ